MQERIIRPFYLFITDHSAFEPSDSTCTLIRALRDWLGSHDVCVASKPLNERHLRCETDIVTCISVDEQFNDDNVDRYFATHDTHRIAISDFRWIFLRLGRPLTDSYLTFLAQHTPNARYVNSPLHLMEVSNKRFLLHFADVCPGASLCRDLDTLMAMVHKRPIVLKPLVGHRGEGMVRVAAIDDVWHEEDRLLGLEATRYLKGLFSSGSEYFAMTYLSRIDRGDKRIIVASGKPMGAILRIPRHNRWLANIARGGRPVACNITAEEFDLVRKVDAELRPRGIHFYGIDTLENDDGQRVLSEVNVVNVGCLKHLVSYWPHVATETIQRLLSLSTDG